MCEGKERVCDISSKFMELACASQPASSIEPRAYFRVSTMRQKKWRHVLGSLDIVNFEDKARERVVLQVWAKYRARTAFHPWANLISKPRKKELETLSAASISSCMPNGWKRNSIARYRYRQVGKRGEVGEARASYRVETIQRKCYKFDLNCFSI